MAGCLKCGAEEFRSERCVAHFLMDKRGADGRYHHLDVDLSLRHLKDVTIKDVTFAGRTRFESCTFNGEVCFENCVFAGNVSFLGTQAYGRLVFRDTRFGQLIDLERTVFAVLSVQRSEFDVPVELTLRGAKVDLYMTTFSGRSRLVGTPFILKLQQVTFRAGVQLRLSRTDVTLHDVEFGASSSLGPWTTPALPDPLPSRLLGVADTDLSQFSVFDTDLSRCTFSGAHNLDRFGVRSLTAFAWAPRGPYTRRRVLWDEGRWRATSLTYGRAHRWRGLVGRDWRDPQVDAALVAGDYRSLRKAREDAKDEPGAADFYYGEMEMRRMARRQEMRQAAAWAQWLTAATEYTLLWLYWLVSGYGLRAWRALTALAVALASASVIFRYAGFPGADHTYAASLRFAIQSAMSLTRGTDEPLTPTGEWVALALRLLGPLLFGLALLALRGRVRR